PRSILFRPTPSSLSFLFPVVAGVGKECPFPRPGKGREGASASRGPPVSYGRRRRPGGVGVLAAVEAADEGVALQHRLAVDLDQAVRLLARRRRARRSQLGRENVPGALVRDAVELDQILDVGAGGLLGAGT